MGLVLRWRNGTKKNTLLISLLLLLLTLWEWWTFMRPCLLLMGAMLSANCSTFDETCTLCCSCLSVMTKSRAVLWTRVVSLRQPYTVLYSCLLCMWVMHSVTFSSYFFFYESDTVSSVRGYFFMTAMHCFVLPCLYLPWCSFGGWLNSNNHLTNLVFMKAMHCLVLPCLCQPRCNPWWLTILEAPSNQPRLYDSDAF